MITYEQATTEGTVHEVHCDPQGDGSDCFGKYSNRYQRNGKTKVWVTRPGQFRIPIKFSMYGPYDYITQDNAKDWHTWADCPKRKV